MNQPILHKSQRYAQLLLAVYLVFFAAFQWHHHCAHVHDAHREICKTSPNEQHIHNQEYAPHNCDICNISLPFVLLPVAAANTFELTILTTEKQILYTNKQFSIAFCIHYRLRGPPPG
jgi:hypothetical protein